MTRFDVARANRGSVRRSRTGCRRFHPGKLTTALLLLVLVTAGCQTLRQLPPADLAAPGWSIRQGQAVWTAGPSAEGVAGDLVLATRGDGACYVQFSKPPFTLATARAESGRWTLEVAAERRHLGGTGPAPARFVWFALAAATSETGNRVDGWRHERRPNGDWRLVHAVTGESLEGYWSP